MAMPFILSPSRCPGCITSTTARHPVHRNWYKLGAVVIVTLADLKSCEKQPLHATKVERAGLPRNTEVQHLYQVHATEMEYQGMLLDLETRQNAEGVYGVRPCPAGLAPGDELKTIVTADANTSLIPCTSARGSTLSANTGSEKRETQPRWRHFLPPRGAYIGSTSGPTSVSNTASCSWISCHHKEASVAPPLPVRPARIRIWTTQLIVTTTSSSTVASLEMVSVGLLASSHRGLLLVSS